MRTGLIAGLIVAGAILLLNFGRALTNADFIYMCAGAALLDGARGGHTILPVSPYFPPGYPCLLWAAVRGGLLLWPGMTALHAGTLLSALGAGLAAGALAAGARLFRLPPAPALLLGLLGASLPDTAEIAFNPHVDALFTGLALCLIVATLCALQGKAGWPIVLLAASCGDILLTLRWHAVLVVGPCLLVLLLSRDKTPAASQRPGPPSLARKTPLVLAPPTVGAALLCAALLAAGWGYGGLWATTGRLQSAAPLQVATGAVYRQAAADGANPALAALFTDYAGWMQHAPPVTTAMLREAERANLPLFLMRKAVLVGVGVCLLLALICRRWPPHAHWLLLFMTGYSAAVATTYFTPRASALVELCALLLTASALHLAFTQEERELRRQKLQQRRLHFKPNAPGLRLDPALLGGALSLALLAGIGYNGWRVQHDLRNQWQAQYAERTAVYAQALDLADGDASAVYGRFDFLPPAAHMPWCLPGPTFTRLWLDDPRVASLVGELLPEMPADQVLRTPASTDQDQAPAPQVILLWPTLDVPQAGMLALQLAAQPGQWRECPTVHTQARLWQRVQAGPPPVLTPVAAPAK